MFAILLLSIYALPSLAASGTGVPPLAPLPATIDTSGNDAWGYVWIRSDSGGPEFNWVDITTIGTDVGDLLGDDTNTGPFSIGFDFQYYWYTVTQFRIGSNGYLSFGNQTANFAAPFAQFPNTASPNDMIAALGGDLDFSAFPATSQCYYWTNGVDSCVVSYIDVTEWQQTPNANLKHTFQFIICGADSSITYQYGEQQGQFNGLNNTTLTIGIENATGSIGLSYAWETSPPHPRLPYNGLAIKWKRLVNTGLQVTDAGVVGGLNTENQGEFFQLNQADTVRAVVKNFGTIDLTSVRVTHAITKTGQPTFRDTVFVDLLAGEEATVVFPQLFTPAVTGSYTATFTTFVAGDGGPLNNTKTAEIRSVNFSTGANTRLAFDTGSIGGGTGWLGGGGFAIDFEVPVEQVRIESVFVSVASITTQPMTVEILEGGSGVPGEVLATRSVNAVVGTNALNFVSDSIRITSGRFFVGARGQMNFNYEVLAPISLRTWEYTNGYAPYRSRDLQDMIIQASVREEEFIPPGPAPADTGVCYATTGHNEPTNPGSLITIDPITGNGTLIGSTGITGDFGAAVPGLAIKSTGEIFATNASDPADLFRIDALTGTGTLVGSTGLYYPDALAFDGNDILYAIDSNNDLYTVDDATGAATLIGPVGANIRGMEFDPTTGILWGGEGGFGGNNDGIYTVDINTGAATLVGTTGLGSNTPAIHFDQAGNMFGSIGGGSAPNQLISIDKSTGVGTIIGDIGFTAVAGMSTRVNRVVLSVEPPKQGVPETFSLAQNFPNPFNPSTTIRFALPKRSSVALKVYDLLGKEVATLVDEVRQPGYHAVRWDGTNGAGSSVATGIYFFRMDAHATEDGSAFSDFKKMLLVK
jgi:hypothetical protein